METFGLEQQEGRGKAGLGQGAWHKGAEGRKDKPDVRVEQELGRGKALGRDEGGAKWGGAQRRGCG